MLQKERAVLARSGSDEAISEIASLRPIVQGFARNNNFGHAVSYMMLAHSDRSATKGPRITLGLLLHPVSK